MNTQLLTENICLREQLQVILGEARLNQDKMHRFDLLERKLIGADKLTELLKLLLTEYQNAFGVEHVTLSLLDQEYEITRVLEEASDNSANMAGLTLLKSAESLEAIFNGSQRPFLGAVSGLQHHALFGAPAGLIASVALLPLIRHGNLIGGFYLGSTDPNRYVSGFGTDFLERLSEIIAICLDNAMSHERLKLMGLTDGLTGVQNRRYFERRLLEETSQAYRHKRALACMFLDIDRFKRINDTYGHQAGDTVLRGVANVIQAQLRVGDTIARYGGEEFCVLLPRTAANHVQEIAERIRITIAEKVFETTAGEEINVTISIGLSMLPVGEMTREPQQLAEQLVSTADKALYQAKHTGRNRVVCDASLPLGSSQSNQSDATPHMFAVLKGLVLLKVNQTVNMLKQLRHA